jgi:intracellular multiplication protein IcmL
MKLNFGKIRDGFRRKFIPYAGLYFAGFMMLALALAGLGPLMLQWAPDSKAIDQVSTAEASKFGEVVAPEGLKPVIPVDLTEPHRGVTQVAEWVALSVGEMLNFSAAGYGTHIVEMGTYANDKARGDFQSFVDQNKIFDTLKNGNLRMNSSAEEAPLLLNKGAVEGSYRWLYEIPVLLTFLPLDAKSYMDSEHVSQHVIVNAQVGRVTYKTNADELQIESFSVRPNPAYK